MSWVEPAQLVGYLGTALFLTASLLLAHGQRTSGLYWALSWVGAGVWITAGIMMEAPAVWVDVVVFLPALLWGTVRWCRWEDED